MDVHDYFMVSKKRLGTPSERLSAIDKPTLGERAMMLTIDEVRVTIMREMAVQLEAMRLLINEDIDRKITALKNSTLTQCEG